MSVYLVPRGIILTCKGLILGRVNCLTIFKLVETWSAPITIPKSSISNFGKYGQNHIFESQYFCQYSFKAFHIISWCLLNIFWGFMDLFQFNLSYRLSFMQNSIIFGIHWGTERSQMLSTFTNRVALEPKDYVRFQPISSRKYFLKRVMNGSGGLQTICQLPIIPKTT